MDIGMMVRRCGLIAAIAACAKTDGRAVMDDSTFVAAMAELHVIERNYRLSDAARDSLRREVLQEQGLTPAALEQQARHYARDPAHASAIWGAISRKTISIATDTTSGRIGEGVPQEQTR